MSFTVPTRLVGPLGAQVCVPSMFVGFWQRGDRVTRDLGSFALTQGAGIDAGEFYGNMRAVGDAARVVLGGLPESGALKPEQVTIIIKVWPSHFGYDETIASVRKQVACLPAGVRIIAMPHWPSQRPDAMLASYHALEQCQRDGLIWRIGVSNFDLPHMMMLHNNDKVEIQPILNQVERHLEYSPDIEMLRIARHWGFGLMASSVFGGARPGVNVLHNERTASVLRLIAEAHGVSLAQVVLAYIGKDYIPVFSTSNPRHLMSNLKQVKLNFSDEEQRALRLLATGRRHRPDPRTFDNKVPVPVLQFAHRTGVARWLDQRGLLK